MSSLIVCLVSHTKTAGTISRTNQIAVTGSVPDEEGEVDRRVKPGSMVCGGHWLLSFVHLISREVQTILPSTSMHVLLPNVGGLLS